jgi:hypothetical protein
MLKGESNVWLVVFGASRRRLLHSRDNCLMPSSSERQGNLGGQYSGWLDTFLGWIAMFVWSLT